MDSYVKAITLDVNADENYTIIKAKQGDKINRKIAITLKKDGANFTPTGVSQIWFRVQKPDKNIAIVKSTDSGNPISSAGNVYTVTLSEQCLTASGKAWCDLAFLDSSGNTLSSCAFILNIIPMPNGNTARSISEWTDLQQAIDDAERFASIVAFRTSGNYIQYTVDGTTWVNLTTVGAIGGDLQTQINALNGAITSLGSDDIANDSTNVSGLKVTNALDTLNGAITSLQNQFPATDITSIADLVTAVQQNNPFTAGILGVNGTVSEALGAGFLNGLVIYKYIKQGQQEVINYACYTKDNLSAGQINIVDNNSISYFYSPYKTRLYMANPISGLEYYMYRSGGIVTIAIGGNTSISASQGWNTLGTLPNEAKSAIAEVRGIATFGTNTYVIRITNNNTLQVNAPSAGSLSFSGSMTFVGN